MELKLFWVVPPGAEKYARQEIIEGWTELEALEEMPPLTEYPGGLEFTASAETLGFWHDHLRIPVRCLIRIWEGPASSWQELESALSSIAWESYYESPAVPKLQVSSRSSKLYHREQIQRRVERWFKQQGAKGGQQGSLFVRLFRDELTLSLDATGEALFKRGDKPAVGKAPLRENLAQLMLRVTTQGMAPEALQQMEFVDPFAGSGTLVLEALGRAHRKRSYAFESWPLLKGLDIKTKEAQVGDWHFGSYRAFDTDESQFEILSQNLTSFKGAPVTLHRENSLKYSAAPSPRVLVTNPPFGGRVGKSQKPVADLLKLLQVFKPYRAAFLVPQSWGMARQLSGSGYHLFKKVPLSHGGLKVEIIAVTQKEPVGLGKIPAEQTPDQKD